MGELTRRKFLVGTSVGIAAVAGGIASAHQLPAPVAPSVDLAEGEELVAHVRSLARGEVSVMVGTSEVVVTDPGLAQKLARVARRR